MSIPKAPPALKDEVLQRSLLELIGFVQQACQQGTAVHEVELGLWQRLLRLGRECLGQFLAACGTGDVGPDLTLPDGRTCGRLPGLHPRRYVSIFGTFRLKRAAYGSREGQAIEVVPLDNRLQLPEGAFSYVLQDWDQSLCVEQAFGQAATTVARILGLVQSVDSLEHMNRAMAQPVTTFLINRPRPEAEHEGEVVVASADQKGVVMRRAADAPPAKAHRSKGDKASRKRMATVAAVYSVDRHVRTAEQVVAALFRDGPAPPARRPVPQGKQVWASLPQEGRPGTGLRGAFAWMVGELFLRGRAPDDKPLVYLSDGQEALWDARREWLPGRAVDILDLLHVTPRLWQAAHAFHKESSDEAEAFVRERVLRVLQGRASGVVRGLREMAIKRGLAGAKRRAVTKACNYLAANLDRMRYDEYLRAGYPIASGVIEGACRHLVKDRLERAGMHWTVEGAQAMLDVRSVHVNGLWDEYQAYRITQEARKLYPHRAWLEQTFGSTA
jgi:hypothetical protein